MDKRFSFSWAEVEPLCLLRLLARKWWLILMAALIGSMITSTTLEHLVTHSYSSSVTFVVTSKSSNNIVTNNSVAGEVANVYSQLLQSDLMSAMVHESLGSVPGKITAKQLGKTNFIQVTVSSPSPKDALLLIQAIIENHTEISDYVSSQAVLSPLDAPSVSVSVSNPYNVTKLTRLAFVGCAAGMCALLVLLSLTSGTIQTKEGAKNRLDCQILATIPHEKEAVRRAGLAKGKTPRGVKVDVNGEDINVDVSVTVDYGMPIQKVGRNAQENVRKSIESMTGLHVEKVDLHVVGVSFEKENQEMQQSQQLALTIEEEHPVAEEPQAEVIFEEEKKDVAVTSEEEKSADDQQDEADAQDTEA